MKLTKLTIDSYRHLEGINFDFTYPEGHAKAGLPLEKICLIGQSATGKTSILELIKSSFLKLESIEIFNDKYLWNSLNLPFNGIIGFWDSNTIPLILAENKIIYGEDEFPKINKSDTGTVGNLFYEGLRLIYFSSEIISKKTIDIINQNPIDLSGSLLNKQGFIIDDRYQVPNYFHEFLEDLKLELWFLLLNKVLDYRKRFTQMASELINKGAIGDMTKLNREYAKWAKENENPLVAFAEYFNPILNKLNLEVDLVNTEYSIPIKSKLKDEVIPISNLSTGTKGLLLSMFPLFEIDTTDAIILVDEPERSLFPDMQIDLIGHYQKMAPNAQFIVATHSPFIAAAFEPEERFLLYFDEKGKVAVRRGESPIGDDPNDMLKNDFKINYYNEFGKKAYQDYLDLKRKVAEEPQPKKKKELIVELAALGDKYNF
jgi:GTPase SAR1 family protein